MYGAKALAAMTDRYEFDTVLDIGCGDGSASLLFTRMGKDVTAIDIGRVPAHRPDGERIAREVISGHDFNTYDFGGRQFDAIWASHVLEHQLNVQAFLLKMVALCKPGGVVAVTVPPYKPEIVGGHVSLWNAGLLLYRLVLAGIDCKHAHVIVHDYNVSVVAANTPARLPRLVYDSGDLSSLRRFFPVETPWVKGAGDIMFDGGAMGAV